MISSRAATLVLVAAVAVTASACGGTDADPTAGSAAVTSTRAADGDSDATTTSGLPADEGGTATTNASETTSSGSSTPAGDDTTDRGSTDRDPAVGDDGEVATPDELRRWLGADHLVVRRADAPALATSDDGELELVDPFPTVRGRYLFDGGALIDITGEAACPGFELLGDFHVIAEVEPTTGDRPSIIVEDRRALATDAGSGSATVPRWRFDCAIGTATDLEPTTEVTYLGDDIQVTRTLTGGLELAETWGLGDTPLALATGSGTVLLTTEQLVYGYVLSPDQGTIYATAYAGTGAGSPPAEVLAIDVGTGEVRWRRDLGGFVWTLDDRVLIEVVEPRPETPGDPGGSEVVLVDPATGADLDRIRFTDRIVGLS